MDMIIVDFIKGKLKIVDHMGKQRICIRLENSDISYCETVIDYMKTSKCTHIYSKSGEEITHFDHPDHPDHPDHSVEGLHAYISVKLPDISIEKIRELLNKTIKYTELYFECEDISKFILC